MSGISTNKLRRMLKHEYPDAELDTTGSGHIRIRLPNGRAVFVSATPSDEYFFLKNVRADIKRKLKENDHGE